MSKQDNTAGGKGGWGTPTEQLQVKTVKASQKARIKSVNMHSVQGVMALHLLIK